MALVVDPREVQGNYQPLRTSVSTSTSTSKRASVSSSTEESKSAAISIELSGETSCRRASVSFASRISEAVEDVDDQRPNRGRNVGFARRPEALYTGSCAVQIRLMLQSVTASVATTLALLVALFLPDLAVACGVNRNFEIDISLTVVMSMFAIEVLAMSLVDGNYCWSFFHMIDIIGTLSMVFDISFLFGEDATKPKTVGRGGGGQPSYNLLRATRAVRLGARAGRLSRVLRLFRFLPLGRSAYSDSDNQTMEEGSSELRVSEVRRSLRGSLYSPLETKPKNERGIASAISMELSNLLATRGACMTIILVMVIPFFEIFTFPEGDNALEAWLERVSVVDEEGNEKQTLQELSRMVNFFDHHTYGPYQACRGRVGVGGNVGFACDTFLSGWRPTLQNPGRQASAWILHTNSFMIAFNMHQPLVSKALRDIATTCFGILIMIVSGMVLSSVVTQLAVRPLERMLTTVRHIARTVFKFSEDSLGEKAGDATDIEGTSEMILLEKVVDRLATIASLNAKGSETMDKMFRVEDMQEEDIGVLAMMRGGNMRLDRGASSGNMTLSSIVAGSAIQRQNMLASQVTLDSVGVSRDCYHSWGFNIMDVNPESRGMVAVYTITHFRDTGVGFVRTKADEDNLQRFVSAAEKEYKPTNPFHNFCHAVDVLHMVSRVLRLIGSESFLSDVQQFALLVAALGHDMGHPGMNNGFLLEVSHELALQYNDRSPLENMHCAKLYSVIGKPDTNVFRPLSKEQYREARKVCIDTILHTDMVGHQGMVKDLQMTYEMNSEALSSARMPPRRYSTGSVRAAMTDDEATNGLHPAVEVFNQTEVKNLVLNALLHSADISNPCRTWDVSYAWAQCCVDEFFAQGDEEKKLGIPVQFLNDRDKLNRPNSQIGFIEFVIAPFFAAQICLWPEMKDFGKNLSFNVFRWEELWIEEVNPSGEEKLKVHVRTEKVSEVLEKAISQNDGTKATPKLQTPKT